jgi:predicted transcriptional regulator
LSVKTSTASHFVRLTPDQIRRSISDEFLLSFEDGKSYRTLKPHLAKLGLTPEAYRDKWGLPRYYPMVAPIYSDCRSGLAKRYRLGCRRRSDVPPDTAKD